MDDEIPYLLLTPGPLTTSGSVKRAMRQDLSTWDRDYNRQVDWVRETLATLASEQPGYTCTLMQGSGTFAVEATLGSTVPLDGKLLIVENGAYGRRMSEIAERLQIAHRRLPHAETRPPDLSRIREVLRDDTAITHVAMVHCETTTGMLNPATDVGRLCCEFEKCYILDAMSSFGGIPLQMEEVGADFLISSANKCLQGVPGFGFVIATESAMQQIAGRARSVSLDLYEQWRVMQTQGGKWRYTSPTHVLCALAQALRELADEGGVAARHGRYCENHRVLVEGLQTHGLRTLLPAELQSPIITAFLYPDDDRFAFDPFYEAMKQRGFVLYPGKLSDADSFRIGTIGHVFPPDIARLVQHVGEALEDSP